MRNMLKKFIRDKSGNVAIMAGVAAVPMFLAVGVGVDLSEASRAKTAFQSSIDAAALATAKTLAGTGSKEKAIKAGEQIFHSNIANLRNSVGTIQIDTGDGDCVANGVTASGTLSHPVYFDAFHKAFSGGGKPGHIDIKAKSVVKCGGDTMEIAMVLDNSGSMNDNGKLSALKKAARNMVVTLKSSIGNQSKPNPLRFSIVPFAGMVNVGNNRANASWMDRNGQSSVHHEHFDWASNTNVNEVNGVFRDQNGRRVTRFSLYNNLGITWQGCVEQRPYPYHTNDETPRSSKPDTLFVPSFAPDEPDDYSGRYVQERRASTNASIYCIQWRNGRQRYRCRVWRDPRPSRKRYGYRYWGSYHPVVGYANRYGGEYDSRGKYIGGGQIVNVGVIQEHRYLNNYLRDEHNRPSGDKDPLQYAAEHVGFRDDQYKRQRWTWKYFNNPQPRDVNDNKSSLPKVVGLEGGPNFYCTTQPLSALTANHGSTLSKINSMKAEGATNIGQGVAWGWRTLSSGAPFTEGRSEGSADNKKIMVIMTDGNNTYYPYARFSSDDINNNPSIYASHGFNGGEYETPLKKRLFDGFKKIANPTDDFDTYRAAMDQHTIETCNNAKASGNIEIYTIAFDVPQGSDVRKMLDKCASKSKEGKPLSYTPDTNKELIEVFQDITKKLSDLAIKS